MQLAVKGGYSRANLQFSNYFGTDTLRWILS